MPKNDSIGILNKTSIVYQNMNDGYTSNTCQNMTARHITPEIPLNLLVFIMCIKLISIYIVNMNVKYVCIFILLCIK